MAHVSRRGRPRLDLTGAVFDRLTVLEFAGRRAGSGHILWKCQCSCGNTTTVLSQNLMSNKVRSCGCLRFEMARAAGKARARRWTKSRPRIALGDILLDDKIEELEGLE